MTLIEKIREIVTKGEKPTYTVKISPEEWEKIEKVMKEYVTELEAEKLSLTRKIQELEKKVRELEGKEAPEEIQVVTEALKKKEAIEKAKKRFRFIPEKKVTVISSGGDVFSSSDGKLPYLKAVELEETENGDFCVNLILTDGKKSGRLETTLSFDQIFNEPNVVSKLCVGTVTVPVNSKGEELLKTSKREDLIGDLKRVSKYYEEEMSKLRKELELANARIGNLGKENETLKTIIERLGDEINILQHKLEVSDALMKALGVREREMQERNALLEISSRDMGIRSILALDEVNQLREAVEHLKNLIATAYITPPDEETRQLVLGEVERISRMIEQLRPREIRIKELPERKAKKGEEGGE